LQTGRSLNDDSQLLEQYFYDYFEVLHRYAYTILKDNEAAKDAVQAVFMQLWQKREELNIRQSVRAYLYTATHNHCLNYLKSNKIRQGHYGKFIAGEALTTEVIHKKMELKELKQEVLTAMDNLPEKCREIFYKSRFEEKTYPEIAAELGISVKTVEAQMGKALRTLRAILPARTAFWLLITTHLFIHITKLPH
jgi:RNA polymerase sigma-70 factor, ECF subfamily